MIKHYIVQCQGLNVGLPIECSRYSISWRRKNQNNPIVLLIYSAQIFFSFGCWHWQWCLMFLLNCWLGKRLTSAKADSLPPFWTVKWRGWLNFYFWTEQYAHCFANITASPIVRKPFSIYNHHLLILYWYIPTFSLILLDLCHFQILYGFSQYYIPVEYTDVTIKCLLSDL